MLRELSIKNFAVIEQQQICFGPGLNVISGETGSGKSIILQALNLLLGAKPRSDYFRTGTEGWELEALFCLSDFKPEIIGQLPEIAQGEELLISRSQSRSGRGKIMINGRLGSLSLVQEIGQVLIELCSHSESLRLTAPAYQLALIDRFAALEDQKREYAQAYQSWKSLDSKLKSFESEQSRMAQRRAELDFVIQELKSLDLKPGCKAELEGRIKLFGNAEKVLEMGRRFEAAMHANGAAFDLIKAAAQELKRLQQIDARYEALSERFNNCESELQDCCAEIMQKTCEVDLDQNSLENLREKLSMLVRLERKYSRDEQGLIELLNNSEKEFALLSEAQNVGELKQNVLSARQALDRLAGELSKKRLAGLSYISSLVEKELVELNMPGVRLGSKHRLIEADETGIDSLELLFSANKGEELKPIAQIASAGELSRIMLVLKKVWGNFGAISVLIFDEIDSGVSGAVARVMGEKLKNIAAHSQVICITHLPQVASLADRHFQVSKQSAAERTLSVVKELSGQAQVEEIARMLAGKKVTKAALASARELLTH